MELKWSYDPDAKLATANLNQTTKYTTPDGGQTINKYVDGNLVKTIHKYGPDKKFTEYAPSGKHIDTDFRDEWFDEIDYLIEHHQHDVGPYIPSSDEGYRTKDGNLEGIGEARGFGINNPVDKICVNRLLAAANITEWWEWQTVATTDKDFGFERPIIWKRNWKTGAVVRVSEGNPPYPCCCYPTIYGPYPVADLDADMLEHNGKFV